MKTVFKVGMEVYDQLVFPDKKGKVVNIAKFDYFPIKVLHEGSKKNISYTEDGRYYTEIEPTLSTKPYTLQGFEQKAPAPTYEKALKEAHRKGDYYYLPDSLEVPSEELVDATIALLKLLFLRDYYNDDWQPDLKNKEQRGIFVILDSEGNFFVWGVLKETETHALVFKDEKVAKRFIEEQKELLEIAKPLL